LYLKLKNSLKEEDVRNIFKERFDSEFFVRVLNPGEAPSLDRVKNTNFCDIGLFIKENKEYAIIVSAIDNLLKGASGQAVQNMNIMMNFDEKEGLL